MRKKLEIGDLSENCIVINYAIWILVTKYFCICLIVCMITYQNMIKRIQK